MPAAAIARPAGDGRTLPHEPQRDEAEGDGEGQVGHPDRHAEGDFLRALLMDLKEPQAAEREDRRDHRADQRGGDRRDVPRQTFRQERAGREREQLAFPRRDGRADEADDERQMRREGRAAGDAGAEEPAQHDFRERQHHDADRGQRAPEDLPRARSGPARRGGVDRRKGPSLFCGRARSSSTAVDARNAVRAPTAASKTSAGTMLPRCVASWLSAAARNAPRAFASSVITCRPAAFISLMDLASRAGACAWICVSIALAASSIFARSSGAILFQALAVMMVALVSGATRMSSMYGASRKNCSVSAKTGGLGAASMAPVGSFSCLGISPALSGTT